MSAWRRVLPLLLPCVAACRLAPYEPEKATRAYPSELVQGSVVQVQVIPEASSVKLVNATASSWSNFDLWLNQRYMTRVDGLAAGQTLEIPLDRFWDERGETPIAGGWFRYYQPTRIVLMQMQLDDKSPLVGLVCTLPEAVRER
jgi:hypothetical protein